LLKSADQLKADAARRLIWGDGNGHKKYANLAEMLKELNGPAVVGGAIELTMWSPQKPTFSM
jgi:hypothetical protein